MALRPLAPKRKTATLNGTSATPAGNSLVRPPLWPFSETESSGPDRKLVIHSALHKTGIGKPK